MREPRTAVNAPVGALPPTLPSTLSPWLAYLIPVMNLRRMIPILWRKIAARPNCRKLNELLFDCALRGLGVLNYEDEKVSGEHYLLEKLLPKYARGHQPVCIDVGANTGSYSEHLLQCNPGARLICLEPHPGNFKKLEERLKGRALLLPNAAGASEGELTLFDRSDFSGQGSQHATLYEQVITDLHKQQSTQTVVKVTTLDQVASDQGLDEIDLIKIDTEGHEYEVLRGCERLLKAKKVKMIHLEFNEMNVISKVFFRHFRELLSEFKPYRLLPTGWISISSTPVRSELFAYQNIVFVRKL